MELPDKGRFDDLENAIETCSKLDREKKLQIKEWLEKEILQALKVEKAA